MHRTIVGHLLSLVVVSASAAVVGAAENDWAEGTPGLENGASRDFYNRAALLPWRHFMGDWRDLNGVTQGNALRSTLLEGTNTAMNVGWHFLDESGAEPEEAYFRYYLRFADDWEQTVDGGKMPGFAGTYGVAGWGGRPSDGTNGWSARGSFYLSVTEDNPLAGTTPLGNYVYHADMTGSYGDVWLWQEDYRGLLTDNRWYCIEQYIKMNTPTVNDGVLRTWVDGRLAFEKTDLRFRDIETLKIEEVWMNVYHGGTAPSPHDQHLYIDNLVIATSYIGPMLDPTLVFSDGFESGDPSAWSSVQVP